ncbi:CBO0543 family protein [Paenibacillus solisilvae]|uniref:CBO0543 family protein n=1 Tax=Paenibacillus solisilvae TaxID=2486751 RepID=A0ABW0W6P4_9BACL
MELIYLAGIAGWVLCAWKWADWSRFREFRASIYVMIIGDFLYNVLTEDNHLWRFESPTFHFSHHFIQVLITLCATPFAVLIFLSHYPSKSILKQVLYLALWAGIFSIHEWIAVQLGVFKYNDGWNMWWSIVINCIAFPFLILHQKRPALAILVFIFFTLLFSFIFQIDVIFKKDT